MTAISLNLRAVISERQLHTETFEVDGRVQCHVEGCSCTTSRVWWPCEVQL